MKNEGDVKKEVKKILTALNAWYFMPVQTGYGVQGIPDFVVCFRGRFIGIETKFGGNLLSQWQEKQRLGICRAKGLFFTIDERTVSDLPAILHGIDVLEGK